MIGWDRSVSDGSVGRHSTASAGWSQRLAPTPATWATRSMPRRSSSPAAPIPDRTRIPGEWIAPAESTKRRAGISVTAPSADSTSTRAPCRPAPRPAG